MTVSRSYLKSLGTKSFRGFAATSTTREHRSRRFEVDIVNAGLRQLVR